MNKGVVRLGMLEQFGLQPIEVRLLPAKDVYRDYLQGQKYKVENLELFDNTSSAATMRKITHGNKVTKMYPGGTSIYGEAATQVKKYNL
ncbi:MAG: hypothetical protein II301_04530 [Peptococcaceae bacterium]|nr:hypothetical protein [Peptococcaceae bacterium]